MENQTSGTGQKHVLVVDDNVELARTYQELLQSCGYQASVASNGVQALKMVMHEAVDLIVTDLTMPQLEGDMFFITVERVRPHLADKFIFITGNGGTPKYEAFLKQVTCPVLFKPVKVDKLLETVAGVLAQPSKGGGT
jgi:DNA-binding NtrC family response regulator